jgi:hypothetical protein
MGRDQGLSLNAAGRYRVTFVVLLDADVASASFLGRLPDRLRARLAAETACITFVTLGEMTK